jgi:Transcription- and export-related complex subunit
MLKQAKQYDNQIEAINLSLQSCNPLSLDVCAYTILRFISDAKDEPLDEEENP